MRIFFTSVFNWHVEILCNLIIETQHVSPPPDLLFYRFQVDNKGRNFLHVAVQNSDIESVLFLISVKANVNSRVQDAAKLTPLHLAVQAGSEIIVRNLVCIQICCRFWSSPVQAPIFLLENAMQLVIAFFPFCFSFVFSCLLEPKLMSWPNTGRQHYIWLPSRILPQFALCC